MGLASGGSTIAPLRPVPEGVGYLESLAASAANSKKVTQITGGTTKAAFKSALASGNVRSFLALTTASDVMVLSAPQVVSENGTDKVVVSLSNDISDTPTCNQTSLENFAGYGYHPVSKATHDHYLQLLDGEDSKFQAPSKLYSVDENHVLRPCVETAGEFYVYLLPTNMPLNNGTVPCQGPADESLFSALGPDESLWAEVKTTSPQLYGDTQTAIIDNLAALDVPKLKTGQHHERTSSVLALTGISAADMASLSGALGAIRDQLRAASEMNKPIPRKQAAPVTDISVAASGATGATATVADADVTRKSQQNILKWVALRSGYRVDTDGTCTVLVANLDDNFRDFAAASDNAERESCMLTINQEREGAKKKNFDMIAVCAKPIDSTNLVNSLLASASFAQHPIRRREDLSNNNALRIGHFDSVTSAAQRRQDQERNNQERQGESKSLLSKANTKLPVITSVTSGSAGRAGSNLLHFFGGASTTTIPTEYHTIDSLLRPVIGLNLSQGFAAAKEDTASLVKGADHTALGMLDEITTSFLQCAHKTSNLKCFESGDFSSFDPTALLKAIDLSQKYEERLSDFITNRTPLQTSAIWLFSSDRAREEQQTRDDMRREIMREMEASGPARDRKPAARKTPPQADGRDNGPAKLARGDTAGDICTTAGVRRLTLPPLGSLSKSPCAAFLRDGYLCRFGDRCNHDHTRINDLPPEDQKAWVRHVGTSPDLKFNPARVASRIVNMPLAEAARA